MASFTKQTHKSHIQVNDLFEIPDRFMRSVHLERDFEDVESLGDYVVTDSIQEAFLQIHHGLRQKSGRRAWRLVGNYGTGKSSFALMLAHLLRDSSNPAFDSIRTQLFEGHHKSQSGYDHSCLIPILVTGSNCSIESAIARALAQAAQRLNREVQNDDLTRIITDATVVEKSSNSEELLRILDRFRKLSAQQYGRGIILILDELGKFLEYVTYHPEREDVYILQQLAEKASRSGKYPFIILGLLHQGIQAYVENLPQSARLEWEKVAGRYDEIVFDQPLAHSSRLISGTLNVDTSKLPEKAVKSVKKLGRLARKTNWLSQSVDDELLSKLYPVHPMTLPVLVRFFARFGQYERSLFSFLLSTEVFGIQSFADQKASDKSWYLLSDFYDYVRSSFGYQLATIRNQRNYWLRIAETIDYAISAELPEKQIQLLKTVAILNLIDAEDLVATKETLKTALTMGVNGWNLDSDLQALQKSGLLYRRGAAGDYCFWAHTSVDMSAAIESAERSIDSIKEIAPRLIPIWTHSQYWHVVTILRLAH